MISYAIRQQVIVKVYANYKQMKGLYINEISWRQDCSQNETPKYFNTFSAYFKSFEQYF